MLTFTQLYTRVVNQIGVNSTTNTQDLSNAKQDINQALRLFKNAARRYWTRKEATTNLVASQQYYTFPEDMVRITEVKANTGGYNWPLVQVDSEQLWNKFNVIPSNTVIVPQFYFIRGRNEIGLYPTPSQNQTAGLIVSYEPRMTDMSIDDVTTTTVTVTQGSQSVTSPSTSFNTNMAGQYFTVSNTDASYDGNWYPIVAATSSILTLENYYQGPTGSGVACQIGQVPDIPEEYHLGLVYYACYNYYLKRNDMNNATIYRAMFDDLLMQFKEVYAAKTTGIVQKPLVDNIFNIFWLPPGTLSGQIMAGNIKNQPKAEIHLNYFQGGVTIDPKLGIANSFYSSKNLDFRSQPSQISVLPGPSNIATNMDDLLLAMEQDVSGVRWGVGAAGNIYKISTSNVVTKVAQMSENGSAGLFYNQVTDQLYIPGQTTVSMYGQVTTGITGNPIFRSNQFTNSASTAPGCVNLFNSDDGFFDGSARNNCQSLGVGITNTVAKNQVVTNSTLTYTTPTTISEASNNYCYFAPDIEPFYSIMVYINNKGTGNWTLTLHDSLNNQLAAVTVTNGNLTSGAYNEFVFSSPIRALVNASQTGTSATYHFHLTSTVTDGKVGVLTYGDLSSCDFLLFANRLLQPKNGWHPTALFTGSGVPLLCIGNGPYLSTYNFGNDSNPTNSQWNRHNLVFKSGYEVCGLAPNNQYLVIACERRSTNTNRNAQDGCLYFWDGTTSAPSMSIQIPMGSPYGLYTHNNVTYFACAGSLFAWSGGQTVVKVRKLAYQNTDYLNAVDSTIINPNMFTSRYNLLEMGYPSSTTNANINYGVWSWGTVELTFPNSYGLSYTLSNGVLNNNTNSITNLKIGCVQNFVDSMYVSWQYTDGNSVTHYGIDLVDNFSAPATSASFQSLIWDGGIRYKSKRAIRMKINYLALPSGASITGQYSIDRGAFITADPSTGTSYTDSTANSTSMVIELNNARFYEIQWGFTITQGTATTPVTVTGITMEVEPLEDETVLRKDNF